MSSAKPFEGITFKELYNKDLPPVEFLVEHLIKKGGLTYVYGPPASFKTNFLLYTVLKGYNGEKISDFEVKNPFKTLWIDEENGPVGMKDKLVKIGKGAGVDIDKIDKNVFFIFNEFKILSPTWILQLNEAVVRHKPDMIVIDSIAKVFDGDERNERDVALIFNAIKPILAKNISVVFIHHSRKLDKKTYGVGLEDLSGSREFGAMNDTAVYLQRIYNSNKYMLRLTKHRYGIDIDDVNFEVTSDDEKITLSNFTVYVPTKTVDKIKDDIHSWMLFDPKPEWTTEEIKNKMSNKPYNHKPTNISKSIKKLIEDNAIIKVRRGVYSLGIK